MSTNPPEVVASGTTNTFTVGGAAVAVDAGLRGSPSGSRFDRCHGDDLVRHTAVGRHAQFHQPERHQRQLCRRRADLERRATVAQYVTALQSVTFSTTNVNKTTRAISIVAFDGALQSTAAEQVKVSIAPPVVTPSGATGYYTLGGAAIAVDSGVDGFVLRHGPDGGDGDDLARHA